MSGTGATGSSAGLGVREVVVHYRDDDGTVATAVDGVSLDVGAGEVVALLGPSGSGKSTLLRAIAGLEPLSAGSISWAGEDLAGLPPHRRGFGLMFQDGQLFGHLDVARNVAFGLEVQHVAKAARRERVEQLLELVGLAGFGRREVATLSGGERQRVALARSLAPRPRLLLLDEPLSALDRALRERLADEVREVLAATGTPALFVTHDHDEAFAVADRIAVMHEAHLLQIDTPPVLWYSPASRTVAEFLGYEAFVEVGAAAATALGSDGSSVLALGPGSLRVTDDGPLHGRVRSAGFRRGVGERDGDVGGGGRLTLVEPSQGRRGSGVASVGSVVRLAPTPGGVARLG